MGIKKDDSLSADSELEFEDLEDDFQQNEPVSEELDSNEDDDVWGTDLGDDVGDSGFSTPLVKHNDLLKELTNFDPFLKGVVNDWLGVVWSEKDESYVRNKEIDPIMNIKGASWCVGILKTYARSNNIITDIGKEDYISIMEDAIDMIFLNLGTREEFGISCSGDVLRVSNELLHSISLVLMGAGDGKYTKFLGTTISRNESVSLGDGKSSGARPKKPGMIKRLTDGIMGGSS